MGLFSSKKIIYVASTPYSLAGDVTERLNYLKTSTTANALKPRSHRYSLADEVTKSLLKGPAINQRVFFRWARQHYDLGMPTAQIINGLATNNQVDVSAEIPVSSGSTATAEAFSIESASIFYWAEQHILVNAPSLVDTDWTADYNSATNEIVIQYEDTSTETIVATGYDKSATYLYVYYTLVTSTPSTHARLWIYQIGSGNATLDALAASSALLPEFFPFIPLRLNNKAIRHADFDAIFEDCSKAYSKATGGRSIDDVLDDIEANPDIGDIDYCYFVYGAPLNTQDNASRHYIYEFFRGLMPYQTWSEIDYQNWEAGVTSTTGEPPTTTIQLKAQSSMLESYDMRLSWITIDETLHTGQGKVGAKMGEVWLENGASFTWTQILGYQETGHDSGVYIPITQDNVIRNTHVFHQTGPNSYRKLTLRGMIHRNFVYGGKTVDITTEEALADVDESGFIVPMHYPTLARLSLKNSTQVAIGNAYLIFNSYHVVKRKWYQTGIFRLITAIFLGIIAAVLFPGAIGLLGANFTVGAALGYTGTMALIVGSIANTLAALVLATIVETTSIAIFGEEIGRILGTLISFIAFQYVATYTSTGSWTLDWGNLLRADNLLKLTNVVAGTVRGWAEVKIGDIQEEMTGLQRSHEDQLRDIEKKTYELLGYGGTILDPLLFDQMQDSSEIAAESSDTFLKRTLLTGTDIAALDAGMIESFTDLSLQLPNSFT